MDLSNITCWKQSDISRLRNQCKSDISNNIPPPRSIQCKQVNIKHFIYHNENLKIQILKLKNNQFEHQAQINILNRKLHGRELQIKQLRKRIQNSDHRLAEQKLKIQQLNNHIELQQKMVVKIKADNKQLHDDNHQFISSNEKLNLQINNLNQEIINLKSKEDNNQTIEESCEVMSIDTNESESENIGPNEALDPEHNHCVEEVRSQSSEPNTQDKEFIVDDVSVDEELTYVQSSDEQEDDYSTQESSLDVVSTNSF